MKKLIFVAFLATTLFVYFACSESGKDELAPVTPPTVEVDDGTTLETIGTGGDGIQLRSCEGCGISECCCRLTVTSSGNVTDGLNSDLSPNE